MPLQPVFLVLLEPTVVEPVLDLDLGKGSLNPYWGNHSRETTVVKGAF